MTLYSVVVFKHQIDEICDLLEHDILSAIYECIYLALSLPFIYTHTRIYVGTLASTPGAGFSILKPYPN